MLASRFCYFLQIRDALHNLLVPLLYMMQQVLHSKVNLDPILWISSELNQQLVHYVHPHGQLFYEQQNQFNVQQL